MRVGCSAYRGLLAAVMLFVASLPAQAQCYSSYPSYSYYPAYRTYSYSYYPSYYPTQTYSYPQQVVVKEVERRPDSYYSSADYYRDQLLSDSVALKVLLGQKAGINPSLGQNMPPAPYQQGSPCEQQVQALKQEMAELRQMLRMQQPHQQLPPPQPHPQPRPEGQGASPRPNQAAGEGALALNGLRGKAALALLVKADCGSCHDKANFERKGRGIQLVDGDSLAEWNAELREKVLDQLVQREMPKDKTLGNERISQYLQAIRESRTNVTRGE